MSLESKRPAEANCIRRAFLRFGRAKWDKRAGALSTVYPTARLRFAPKRMRLLRAASHAFASQAKGAQNPFASQRRQFPDPAKAVGRPAQLPEEG